MKVENCATYRAPHQCPEAHYSYCPACKNDKAVGASGRCKHCGANKTTQATGDTMITEVMQHNYPQAKPEPPTGQIILTIDAQGLTGDAITAIADYLLALPRCLRVTARGIVAERRTCPELRGEG
jgi:hypothetical protein